MQASIIEQETDEGGFKLCADYYERLNRKTLLSTTTFRRPPAFDDHLLDCFRQSDVVVGSQMAAGYLGNMRKQASWCLGAPDRLICS